MNWLGPGDDLQQMRRKLIDVLIHNNLIPPL